MAPRTAAPGLLTALALLLLQLLLLGAGLGLTGRLAPEPVNDTPTYANFDWSSWSAALNQIRTPAYPALLAAARFPGDDYRGVPVVHLLLYGVGVLIFFAGARAMFESDVVACVAASSLLYSRILCGYVMTIATDTVAAAAGIATCGLTLWWIARRGPRLGAALAIVSALGWLIRPANLFLVPLVPVLAGLLGSRQRDATRQWRTIGIALLLTLLPVCGYSLLRYAVVGRFSVVSFGGYNQIGIYGQWLKEADVSQLPEDLRPVAVQVLAARSTAGPSADATAELPPLNYTRMEVRYDHTIWNEYVPAARATWGDDQGGINAGLRRLASALVRLHPHEAATWIAKAIRQGAKKVLWDFADNPFTLGLLLLGVACILRPGFLAAPGAAVAGCDGGDAVRVLLVTATVYLVLALAVVIPVCPPLGRMTDAAAVLLAAPLAVWLIPVRWRAAAVRSL